MTYSTVCIITNYTLYLLIFLFRSQMIQSKKRVDRLYEEEKSRYVSTLRSIAQNFVFPPPPS